MTENTLPKIEGLAAQVKNLKDTFGVMQQDLEEMEARQVELLNELGNKGLLNLTSVKKNAELQLEHDQLTVAIKSLTDKIKEMKMDFPYLIDENQDVVKSLGAVCTPELFLFDAEQRLYYHGRLDDNWQDARSVKEEDLREALMHLFSKQEPPLPQYPSQGCSIKWKESVLG